MQSDEDSVGRHGRGAAHERSRKEQEISYKYLGGLAYIGNDGDISQARSDRCR
jgi:hypothetical protein